MPRADGRSARALVRLAAALGLALLAAGCWTPVKAWLAQRLLAHAWQEARAGVPAPRPWPWADTWPVARLDAPRLGVSRIVLAGASGRNLAFGPAHVAGTADPGFDGNIAVAGHRDTHFAFLRELEDGDLLRLESPAGRVRRYRVEERMVVHESATEILDAVDGSTLTLVTCWPFDAATPGGPLRFVVRATAAPDGER